MSARAAWRLESLGFSTVYDYETGKQNWLASGLPIEGTLAKVPRAGTVARTDAPRCRLDERLGDVAERVRAGGWSACVVVNEKRVVLGLLRSEQLDGEAGARIEEAMRPGPSTFRPHVFASDMADYMRRHDLESAPVTRGDGTLVASAASSAASRSATGARSSSSANPSPNRTSTAASPRVASGPRRS